MRKQPMEARAATFLTDTTHVNRSKQTCCVYATNLVHCCTFFQGIVRAITTKVLRNFIATHLHLGPATRTRKQAAVACFYTWVESMT
jgi:hypothetical protein